MGHPKQLINYQGQALIRHQLNTIMALDPAHIQVVLGAHAEAILPELEDFPADIIRNEAWDEGLSTSIRAGIKAVPSTIHAILFMLVDQPLIETSFLQRLLDQANQEKVWISCAYYHGKYGVPALFKRPLFGALQELKGDQGAKPLFQQNTPHLVGIDYPPAGFDLDRPEDLDFI